MWAAAHLQVQPREHVLLEVAVERPSDRPAMQEEQGEEGGHQEEPACRRVWIRELLSRGIYERKLPPATA